MKILLTTIYAYPPRGGLGKYMHELKRGLEKGGHEVEILARHHGEYYLTKSNGRFLVKIKKSNSRENSLLSSVWVGKKGLKYFKKIQDETKKYFDAVRSIDLNQYQVIHAQEIISASVLNVYTPRSTPVILTLHGCVTAEYYYYGFIKPGSSGWNLLSSFESMVIQQCDKTIVPSRWLLDVCQKCGIPTGNIQVISNGIDIQAFRRQMNKKTGLSSSSKEKIIICTGRLEKVKGQHVLLDSLAQLKRKRSDWVCWIVGKGGMEKTLKKKSKRLGLGSNVKFLGRREDIPALLKQADIFVIPSLEDNYPYSLMEAQVAGKAIIGSNTGGITEMVDHSKNGLLVPPGNSLALYREMKKLLENPGLRKRMSSKSESWSLKRCSLTTMTKQVLNVYTRAKNNKSATRSDQ
ncbi:glycosyltransferase family 4 protein [Paenibacillus lautus]|uniref:glycosyltransferase family 4 protein n=1 Tax=Paenibacillus lautus TaxID=1401 RepID=UPI001C11F3A0|nr:glycosyltransferase family 4 protein [Paenibacillus lautus]MBU5350608.1 glycosyltransferase family 4 protein [Paenibacillus lautus]